MTHAAAPTETVAERPTGDPLVPRLELAEWRDRYGIVAGITGRAGNFDLGFFTPAPADAVLTRWLAFQRSLTPAFHGVALSRQAHGASVQTYHRAGAGLRLSEGFDGLVTRVAGLALGVTVADCVPIYLAQPAARVVALLHAGWRGTAAGILEAGIEELSRQTDCSPSDIVMHCGIAICGDCYEVSPEVVERVTGRRPPGREPLDLRANLLLRARRLGLTAVTVSRWCTAHDREFFFSHRRSGGTEGRMVAYLGLPANRHSGAFTPEPRSRGSW